MNNIHYLIIGLALIFAVVSIIKPLTWPLAVSVLLICIELFSRASKSVLIIGILALSLCVARTQSVTNLPPLVTAPLKYLEANTNALKATNWTVAPYFSHVNNPPNGGSKNGGGLAAIYYINPYVGTQIRFQYLDLGSTTSDKVWLPNGTITLQSVYRPLGEGIPITLRPIIEAGVAANLSGQMYAIAGAGSEIDFFANKNPDATIQRVSAFYGIEDWQGQGNKFTVNQFGLAVNMNLEKILTKIGNIFHK